MSVNPVSAACVYAAGIRPVGVIIVEAKAKTIIRVMVVYERQDEEITKEEFDLAPEEVCVIAPLIGVMRLEHPPEEDRRG